MRLASARVSLLLASLVLHTGPARAEPPAGTSRTVVFLATDGADGSARRAVLDAVRAQLRDLPVTLRVEDAPGPRDDLRATAARARSVAEQHHAVGVLWLDLHAGGDALLYVVEPAGERVLVRRVQAEKSSAAELEQLGLIVRGTVTALLDGAVVGLVPREGSASAPTAERAPAPSAAAPPPPAPDRAAPPSPPAVPPPSVLRRFTIGLGYAGNAFVSGGAWQSGLRVSVTFQASSVFDVTAGYTIFQPTELRVAAAVVRLHRHPIEVGLSRHLRFGRLGVRAAALAFVDPITRATLSIAGASSLPSDRTSFVGGFSPRIEGTFGLTPTVRLFAGGGADIGVNRIGYAVGPADAEDTTWLVRPRLDAGLLVDL